MILQSGITRNRTLQPARNEEIRPFTAVSSFQDISVRHTLKEVVRQHKELGNVRRSDFRVYNRPRTWLDTDIVICLDTSGSIADHRKLIYERLAAAAITEAAQDNGDRTAVVTFESASNTPIALSDESNEQVNDYLATLSVKGGTNIAEGLKCAVDLLTSDINHNKKHIFLISDGEPNIISEKALKSLQGKKETLRDPNEEAVLVETRRASAKGINVSVVLLAADQPKGYNFAKNVARAGNGSIIVLDCGDETPIIPELVKKSNPQPVRAQENTGTRRE
jgi:Mg-chelatase subunit ChlD